MLDFEGLSSGECSYIVELLSAMESIENIKTKFREFSGREITPALVYKIALRFSKQIREKTKTYLDNVGGEPLAHSRIRLRILNKVIEDASIQRPSHTVKELKTDPNTGEVTENVILVKKADNASVIAALGLAQKEINEDRKLRVLEDKNKVVEDDGQD